jgi:hypothetical protein
MSLKSTRTGYVRILQVLFSVLIFAFSPLLTNLPQLVQAEEAEADGSAVEYWAVIVGVSDYQTASLHVKYTDSGAVELAEQLLAIWGKSHVQLLTNTLASKDNVHNAICQWLERNAGENDVVLFYFAGHGFFRNLVPYDGQRTDVETMISSWELNKWFDSLNSNNIIIILDACSSGSFIADLSKNGRIILTSSTLSQSSWSIDSIEHCVFTHFILESLNESEEADSNGDYGISAEEVFTYSDPKTTSYMEDLDEIQTPLMDDQYEGDLGIFKFDIFDVNINSIPLLIDGVEYQSNELPVTFKWLPDSIHQCEALPFVNCAVGTRYGFVSWNDGNASPTREVSIGGEYTANYLTQYYLTVESNYSNPIGEGWYYTGTNASISIPSPTGSIIRRVCIGWSGDINSSTPETTLSMDRPMTVIANWRKDYSQLYILIAGIVMMIALGVFFLVKKRRSIK